MMGLIDRGIWSDEVEAICRVGAALLTIARKKMVDWKSLLPEKYIASATISDIPTPSELKQIQRGIAAQLDAFAREFKK